MAVDDRAIETGEGSDLRKPRLARNASVRELSMAASDGTRKAMSAGHASASLPFQRMFVCVCVCIGIARFCVCVCAYMHSGIRPVHPIPIPVPPSISIPWLEKYVLFVCLFSSSCGGWPYVLFCCLFVPIFFFFGNSKNNLCIILFLFASSILPCHHQQTKHPRASFFMSTTCVCVCVCLCASCVCSLSSAFLLLAHVW